MDTFYLDHVFERIRNDKIIATVVVDDLDNTIPLAETLYEAGIHCIELTLRTSCALKAISLVANKMPKILIGAGTVITQEQLLQAKEAGANFAVSPGIDTAVLEKAQDLRFPFSPGVLTPSDIQIALNYNYKHLKFFPAEPFGGIQYLKCMAAPYVHMGICFIPLGGINESNFLSYLKEDLVAAVGGSWIAPRGMIADGDWNGISKLCYQSLSQMSILLNPSPLSKSARGRIRTADIMKKGDFEKTPNIEQIADK